MQIILDTNFVLTCVKQKIDLFKDMRNLLPEAKIVIPVGVISEMNSLTTDKKLTMAEREAAEISVQIVGNEKIIILDLEEDVDTSIVNYASRNPKVVVASLDRGIKARLKKERGVRFLTIRGMKKIALA